MSSKMKNMRVRQVLKERLDRIPMNEFFSVVGIGVGIGLLMGYFEGTLAYIVCMTIAITAIVTAFLIFFIPKLVGMFKKPDPVMSIGEYLARGPDKEHDIPRLNLRTKIRPMEPEF